MMEEVRLRSVGTFGFNSRLTNPSELKIGRPKSSDCLPCDALLLKFDVLLLTLCPYLYFSHNFSLFPLLCSFALLFASHAFAFTTFHPIPSHHK